MTLLSPLSRDSLTLFLICAPSGSGKSTYAEILLLSCVQDIRIICPDKMREELTGDMSDQSCNGFIFSELVPTRIGEARMEGEHIILDATNTTRKGRKAIVRYAKELGYRVEAHVLRVPIEVCQARNAARSRVIPSEVIERQFAQWQEPTLDEGIDEVVEVTP